MSYGIKKAKVELSIGDFRNERFLWYFQFNFVWKDRNFRREIRFFSKKLLLRIENISLTFPKKLSRLSYKQKFDELEKIKLSPQNRYFSSLISYVMGLRPDLPEFSKYLTVWMLSRLECL